MTPRRLEGHTAFVTGGAGGIGSAICERFASEGACVVIADLVLDQAVEVAEQLVAQGHPAMPSRSTSQTARAGTPRSPAYRPPSPTSTLWPMSPASSATAR